VPGFNEPPERGWGSGYARGDLGSPLPEHAGVSLSSQVCVRT
jgi:hypothetical protein